MKPYISYTQSGIRLVSREGVDALARRGRLRQPRR
jgi:hypothetical protein